jgi:hypothetical protein
MVYCISYLQSDPTKRILMEGARQIRVHCCKHNVQEPSRTH